MRIDWRSKKRNMDKRVDMYSHPGVGQVIYRNEWRKPRYTKHGATDKRKILLACILMISVLGLLFWMIITTTETSKAEPPKNGVTNFIPGQIESIKNYLSNATPATFISPHNETTQGSIGSIDVSKYMSSPKQINYGYILRGSHSQISYTVYSGMNDYLRSQPREIIYNEGQSPPTDIDFIMRDLNNAEQKPLINQLIKKIQNITSNRDDQARIAISIVQSINYDWNGFNTGVINGKYPYEVLYTGSGVCSEKSELLAYMLRELGYGVVIFRFNVENHDAVGIKCPQSYSYRNSGYCFVESTTPSIITDSSGDYIGVGTLTSSPEILTISDGNSFNSISEEYDDAVTLNNIDSIAKNNNGVLDEPNYNRWKSLESKYGITPTLK